MTAIYRSPIKVHTDELTRVHSARSSLQTVTHPSTNGVQRCSSRVSLETVFLHAPLLYIPPKCAALNCQSHTVYHRKQLHEPADNGAHTKSNVSVATESHRHQQTTSRCQSRSPYGHRRIYTSKASNTVGRRSHGKLNMNIN